MFLNRELSKKYLAGTLSPNENYRIEDRLLENDFGYEAFEGLEQVPGDQWQKHLADTESRIVEEFGILHNQGLSRNVILGLVGLMVTIMATWYLFTPNPDAMDLTGNQVEISSDASTAEVDESPPIDSVADVQVEPEIIPELKTAKPTKKEPVKPPSIIPKNVKTHITVGRIVDNKGIPVVKAIVSAGKATDTTDKSGYYALKVTQEGIKVKVMHLSTPYLVEIDSHQSWEIVLDIAQQKVIDYYPMTAANRFK